MARKISDSVYKMGWCSGIEAELAHKDCAYKTYSEMTKQEYICGCECHSGKD